MLEEAIVVERDLAIQGDQALFLRDDQRVDLYQRRILLHEQPIEIPQHFHERSDHRRFKLLQTKSKRHIAAVVPLEAHCGINRFLDDLFRCLCSDLFDFHPAFGAGNERRPPGVAIDENR